MRFCVRLLLLSIAWCAGTAVAQAQGTGATSYPLKPVRLILGPAPGSVADGLTRVLAASLSELWGQQVIVDNRPGAGNTIAPAIVAKSAPDGYALHRCGVGDSIAPALYKKLPYDHLRDFALLARIGLTPNILVVHPSVPAKNVQELVAYAKANPRKLNFSSPGIGSGSQLATEYFKSVAGIDLVHVPYKGTGAAIADLIAGNVQMSIDSMAALLPHIKSGALRALAVAYPERASALPDVPTLAETYPGFDASPMNYLSVRGGTPAPIVERLNREVNAVLAMPAVKQRLQDMGVLVSPSTPDEIARHVESERQKYKRVIEISGAKAE